MNRYTFARHLVALITVGLVVAACQPASTPSASGSPGQIGGTVSVLATWGGSEQDSFLAMVKPFEDQTGVKVQYEGTRDNAVLTTRIQGGNPPDLAGLPGPGLMAQLAKAGKLIDLGNVLDMNAMKSQYSDSFIKLAQVDGKQVGIFIKAALKGPIWYNPKAFSAKGYTVPKTWDDLTSLSKKIADSGTTPWCIGLESGAASGWPGTDWLEDIVIRQSGPDVYDSWWQGRWFSAESRRWSRRPSATVATRCSRTRRSATCITRRRSSPTSSPRRTRRSSPVTTSTSS